MYEMWASLTPRERERERERYYEQETYLQGSGISKYD